VASKELIHIPRPDEVVNQEILAAGFARRRILANGT
jgi:hypothetical protein